MAELKDQVVLRGPLEFKVQPVLQVLKVRPVLLEAEQALLVLKGQPALKVQ